MKIYMIAYVKLHEDSGYGFKRIHFQTFFRNEKEAIDKAKKYFCDEAGFYEGILIEEKEEGNPFYHGKRHYFYWDQNRKMKKIKEPDYFKNVGNLI